MFWIKIHIFFITNAENCLHVSLLISLNGGLYIPSYVLCCIAAVSYTCNLNSTLNVFAEMLMIHTKCTNTDVSVVRRNKRCQHFILAGCRRGKEHNGREKKSISRRPLRWKSLMLLIKASHGQHTRLLNDSQKCSSHPLCVLSCSGNRSHMVGKETPI